MSTNPVFAAFLFVCACDANTGGRPIQFSLGVAGEAPVGTTTPGRFVTSTGWEISLEEACIAVGPVYFFAGAGHLARLHRWLVPQAHAHPGDNHFAGGEVRGEWLGQVALDALRATPLPLGMQNGLEGDVRSFSLWLEPPKGALAQDPCLRGHHAYARGVAHKDATVVPFVGALDLDDVGTNRRVEGLPFAANLTNEAAVVLGARPASWFDLADFGTLDTRDAEGRFVITPTTQVRRAWFIGARGSGSFSARLEGAAP